MKKVSRLVLSLIIGLFIFSTNVFAKNEITLNFDGGIIHDGYVEYAEIGKLQLFKGDDLVVNVENNMKIDLDEDSYNLSIEALTASGMTNTLSVKLKINKWYYASTRSNSKIEFNLDSSKFSETLDIKLERTGAVVNTKVEDVFTKIKPIATIDLTSDCVIDFTKEDELTKSLKMFADLEKTIYYKIESNGLVKTENENEANIKIVGNKAENKAIIKVLNVGNKKEETIKGVKVVYTGSDLKYQGSVEDIITETRTDYYTINDYEYTFQYSKKETTDYKFIEGENQIYTINKFDKMTFRINVDYSLFENGGKVFIDDVLVDSKNYTSLSGSTIITFNREYVDTLKLGEHTLKVVFNNGVETSTKFTINEEVKNPKTSDNVFTYIMLSVISVLGIITILLFNNKKIKN